MTDGIETFTESGLKLSSGAELEADVIVTATGLNLLLLGGIEVVVDGEEVDFSERIAYKGMMLSGVPNLAIALGYTNASWTLKCDLVAQYACRLINHMDEHGYASATPQAPDPSLPTAAIPRLHLRLRAALDRRPAEARRPPLPGASTRTTSATCACCATARWTTRWSSSAQASAQTSPERR